VTRWERKQHGISVTRHNLAAIGSGMCGQRRDDVTHVMVTAKGRSNCDECRSRHAAAVARGGATFTTVKPELCV
jgi:hypothetical protein